MLEILYKILIVSDDNDICRELLTMDCLVCENKDHFKNIIRDSFGENIKFKFTKNLRKGDLYCTIIGELTYNKERYFNKKEFVCSCCGAKVTAFRNNIYKIDEGNIKWQLFNSQNNYSKHLFCSYECKNKFLEEEKKRINPDVETDFYIRKEDFEDKNINGYIYKITKKTTHEFYVGKTVNFPIWRWGQHLLTDRFPKEKTEDYTFEVIEVVKNNMELSEREKYWINKNYIKNKNLCLNIQIPKYENIDNVTIFEVMKE